MVVQLTTSSHSIYHSINYIIRIPKQNEQKTSTNHKNHERDNFS